MKTGPQVKFFFKVIQLVRKLRLESDLQKKKKNTSVFLERAKPLQSENLLVLTTHLTWRNLVNFMTSASIHILGIIIILLSWGGH